MMLGKAMVYLDTSVVVAQLTPGEHSALGIKQRRHGLSHVACQAAGEQFERRLQDRGRVLRPGDGSLVSLTWIFITTQL
jgi:hypothetical protein